MAYRRSGKRLLDLVLVAVSAPVVLPVVAATALAVRLTTGSPVLFRQERTGKDGASFVLVKFRTMSDDRGHDGELLPDSERISRVGAFLRSASLDELPQLIHVLTGDMSLVGPRPLLPQYLPHYNDEQARRHEVRPGLTGLSQTSGRNLLSWEEQFELDVAYVDSVSLRTDLKVLVATISEVLARDRASSGAAETKPLFRQGENDSG